MNSAPVAPRQTGTCAGKTSLLHKAGREAGKVTETSSELRNKLESGNKSRGTSSRSSRGSSLASSSRESASVPRPPGRGLCRWPGSNTASSQGRAISKPSRVSSQDSHTVTTTCPLCRKLIAPGQKYMELSVTIPDPLGTCKRTSEKHQAKSTSSRRVVSVPPAGGLRVSPADGTVSAPFHVDCLTCAECGKPLVAAEAGTAAGEKASRVIFDKNGAIDAFTSVVKEREEQARASRKKGTTSGSSGSRPVFPIAAVRHFVFHEKCQQRPCSVCHQVIKPGEPQLALPKKFPRESSASEPPGKSRCEVAHSERTGQSDVLEAAMLAKKTERDNQLYQHLACTRCFTCGQGFVMEKQSGSQPYMLLDEMRQPHHPMCLACCCCRSPLVAKYEIQSFFGKLQLCRTAMSSARSLSPLPGGVGAGVLKVVSSSEGGATGTVTAKFGGLCCAWCAARVPRCLCCERRCAVYEARDGRKIPPRAITKAARSAAEQAAAIGLGKVKPSSASQEHSSSSGEASSGGLYGEVRGVMCGQCAALPVVETEPALRSVAEWLLRLYADAGLGFSSDMVRLQQLMRSVSEGEKKQQRGLADQGRSGREEGGGTGRTAGSRVRTAAARTVNSRALGVLQSGSLPTTKAKASTTSIARIDDLVVPIELVDFSELNPDLVTSKLTKEASQKTVAAGRAQAKSVSVISGRTDSSISRNGKTLGVGAPDRGLSLCGRCHVQEVTLTASPGAALQFDEQVRAQALAERRRLNGDSVTDASPGGHKTTEPAGGHSEPSGGDLHLRRQSTFVHRGILEVASAYAASLEGNLVAGAIKDPSKAQAHRRSEDGQPGLRPRDDVRPEVAAGALLMTGSFAGGLVRTLTGTHTQGLSVRLVERVCVVGHVPRVLVVQHLGHELLHAYLACKQKVITDHTVEEGACNVAAAEALLHRVAELVAENSDITDARGSLTKREDYTVSEGGKCGSSDSAFELLVLQYRLWKMRESKDPVYGEGYRKCLAVVDSKQFSFGEFVEWLLVS